MESRFYHNSVLTVEIVTSVMCCVYVNTFWTNCAISCLVIQYICFLLLIFYSSIFVCLLYVVEFISITYVVGE